MIKANESFFNTMDKLHITGQNIGRCFNLTQPRQLWGSPPLDIALPDKTYKVAGVGEGLDEGSHHLGHLRGVHDGVSAENIMKLIFLATNSSAK